MQLTRSMASLFAVVSLAAATAVPRAAESDASILAALPKFVPEAGLPEVPAELVKQLVSSANTTNDTSLTKRSVHCETSGGSPSTGDAQAASQFIQGLGHGNSCCQNNAGGSWCTTMYCTGSACVGICNNSPGISFPGCDFCDDAGNGLLDISNSCSSGGRSGGWADAPFDLHVVLFHS